MQDIFMPLSPLLSGKHFKAPPLARSLAARGRSRMPQVSRPIALLTNVIFVISPHFSRAPHSPHLIRAILQREWAAALTLGEEILAFGALSADADFLHFIARPWYVIAAYLMLARWYALQCLPCSIMLHSPIPLFDVWLSLASHEARLACVTTRGDDASKMLLPSFISGMHKRFIFATLLDDFAFHYLFRVGGISLMGKLGESDGFVYAPPLADAPPPRRDDEIWLTFSLADDAPPFYFDDYSYFEPIVTWLYLFLFCAVQRHTLPSPAYGKARFISTVYARMPIHFCSFCLWL